MDERAVRVYMRDMVADHMDHGEINCTALAEDAAAAFDLYGPEPDCRIPDELYEWSAEAAEAYEG